jgi:hypothetical protein
VRSSAGPKSKQSKKPAERAEQHANGEPGMTWASRGLEGTVAELCLLGDSEGLLQSFVC